MYMASSWPVCVRSAASVLFTANADFLAFVAKPLLLPNSQLAPCRSRSLSVARQQGSMVFPSPLVSTDELEKALQAYPDLIRCVDSSWYLGENKNARKRFAESHLPGAVFFDIEEIVNKASPLPHMIPSEDVFSSKVSDLGISNEHTVVVYADAGSFSAPRCWWTFRAFGHEAVHVLDGGLPAWKEAGGALEQGDAKVVSTRPSPGLVQSSGNTWKLQQKGFQARFDARMLRTWRQVLAQSESGPASGGEVVDARSLKRFHGEAPEPRPGLASGHIPGSICLPFTDVAVEGNVNKFLTPEEIRRKVEAAGIDIDSPLPITMTCGSGVTAAMLVFALELVGRKAELSPVYDGSWSEWGARQDLPHAV